MYRYVCLVWDRHDEQATAAAHAISDMIATNASAPGLSPCYTKDGFLLYRGAQDTAPIVAERESGRTGACIVFGSLFDRSHSNDRPTPIRSLDTCALDDIISNHGQAIGQRYWGRYLIFVADFASETKIVIPDIFGSTTCYHCTIDGVTILFSNFCDIMNVPGLDRRLSTDHIKVLLTATPDESPNTGIRGVRKVPHGYYLRLTNHAEELGFVWTMREAVDRELRAGDDTAAARLREAILSSVYGHLSGHDRLLVKLSGGLDSNIILAAARHVRPDTEILCVHASFNDPAADEAALAELGARRAGARFVNILYGYDAFSYSRLFDQPLIPEKISSYYQKCIYDEAKRQYDAFGATIVLSGHGGDEIFLPPVGTYIAADYMRRYGFSSGLPSVLLDAARHGSESVFRTLLCAIQYGLCHKPHAKLYRSVLEGNSYIPPELFEGMDAEQLTHGWLKELRGLPPAKFVHTKIVSHGARSSITYNSQSYFNEVIPLYSQPLIETALGIPSYQLALNGRGRGLVRKAFDDLVPLEIVWRESKATGDQFMSQVVYSQRDFIRSILLDGWLVKNRFLDGAVIEKALDESTISLNDDNAYLLHFVEVEAWVQQWLSNP